MNCEKKTESGAEECSVLHEDHSAYTEKSPFIFHYDVFRRDDAADRENGGGLTAARQYNWHNNMEILRFCKGEGTLYCGNEVFTAKAGHLYIINPNRLHAVESESETEYYCLIIDRDFCLRNGVPADAIEYTNACPEDGEVLAAFDTVRDALVSPADTPFRKVAVNSAVLALLLILCRKRSTVPDSTEERGGEEHILRSVKAAISYIDAHLCERLRLDDIAAAAGMSKYYFAGEFRKNIGCTCVEYVNGLRCRHAKALLLTGNYTVSEAGFACGFDNLSYFSKTFTRYMGMSPSECKNTKK